MSADEETPLLQDETTNQEIQDHEAVYNRFTKTQKRTITALISYAGLIPLFIAGSFIPSIPQIAKELESNASVVNFAFSLSIFGNAFGSLVWSAYSSYYGRRPIYLLSIALECIGSFGVASSRNIPQLLSWRVVQALGASSGIAVGMGVIGDIYKVEERGAASGIFFAAMLLGPSLAPVVGGFTTHYYSWRAMQYALSGAGCISLLLITLFQPETSQPGARGIDKARAEGKEAGFVLLNPFRSLAMLRSPVVSLMMLQGAFVLLTDYVLLLPIAFTMKAKYGITNEAAIGALCIPIGLGSLTGAPLAGALSDRVVKKWRVKRGNKWVPEDRLRATLLGAAVICPCACLFAGLTMEFVPGTAGLVLNCVFLFFNGLGVDFVLSPSSAYYVDILHDRSAEVTAAAMSFRSAILSSSVVLILPSINWIGIVPTHAIASALVWIGFGFTVLVIKYGERLRAWVDLGFTTAKDN